MAAIPSSVALTGIADGASIVAADHRNNYNAIQTFINALQAILAGGTAGMKLQSDGAAAMSWQYPPGYEFDTASATSDVSVTGTSTGSPTTIVTGNSVTYDGSTKVRVEFACASVSAGNPANIVNWGLWEDGSFRCQLGKFDPGVATASAPGGTSAIEFTPASGSHTYAIKAWTSSGTATVHAGAGTSGASVPALMTVKRA